MPAPHFDALSAVRADAKRCVSLVLRKCHRALVWDPQLSTARLLFRELPHCAGHTGSEHKQVVTPDRWDRTAQAQLLPASGH